MDKQRQKRRQIIPQMFDVRPVDRSGDLDWGRIQKVQKTVRIPKAHRISHVTDGLGEQRNNHFRRRVYSAEARRFALSMEEEKVRSRVDKAYDTPRISEDRHIYDVANVANVANVRVEFKGESGPQVDAYDKPQKHTPKISKNKKKKARLPGDFGLKDIFGEMKMLPGFRTRKLFLSFSWAGAAIFLIIFSTAYIYRGLAVKDNSLLNGQEALASLNEAKDGIKNHDWQKSQMDFSDAYDRLDKISKDTDSLGSIIVEASKYLPFVSKLGSGAHMAEAGKDISKIGTLSSKILANMEQIKDTRNVENGEHQQISYLKLFKDTDSDLKEIYLLTDDLSQNLDEINPSDIPESQRDRFLTIKSQLPQARQFLGEFIGYEKIFTDILGGNGPRKYLFLFQNNQEARATGGFIGTYALLDIFDGHIRKFFVDGIFNPDGQLTKNVVPPAPIQKISAAWSLHDSNWFPDFPVSAQKAAWFYENTGGPTVDGIITMTPEVLRKLLEITGPVEMPDYGVTIDKDNFLENIQQEVEVDYDKDLNQPKKILSDLAPKILEKIFNDGSLPQMARTMDVLVRSLNERHILIYSNNYDIEKALSQRGWTGEILKTDKDYLMAINTNINGYKTDGVIDESIEHSAEIRPDGSIVDTVTITRHHNGGDTKYDWWNKVNADYLRVYVPKGSQLLMAEGQTREFVSPPLDYDALGFQRDPQVRMEEDSTRVDEASGTRVYDDAGKTVFANWIYVSPKETAHITYKYLLPFKVSPDDSSKLSDSYSILFQKQSGSAGSKITSVIRYPKGLRNIWSYPENISRFDGDETSGIKMVADLKTDKFSAVALSR